MPVLSPELRTKILGLKIWSWMGLHASGNDERSGRQGTPQGKVKNGVVLFMIEDKWQQLPHELWAWKPRGTTYRRCGSCNFDHHCKHASKNDIWEEYDYTMWTPEVWISRGIQNFFFVSQTHTTSCSSSVLPDPRVPGSHAAQGQLRGCLGLASDVILLRWARNFRLSCSSAYMGRWMTPARYWHAGLCAGTGTNNAGPVPSPMESVSDTQRSECWTLSASSNMIRLGTTYRSLPGTSRLFLPIATNQKLRGCTSSIRAGGRDSWRSLVHSLHIARSDPSTSLFLDHFPRRPHDESRGWS